MHDEPPLPDLDPIDSMTTDEIACHAAQVHIAATAEAAALAWDLAELERRAAELSAWHNSREARGLSPWP